MKVGRRVDITKIRPRLSNLRARAIDDKRQMVFWDAPSGGTLVGYDIRVRVNGEQEDWTEVPLEMVSKSDSFHSTVITHGSIDPQEIVVSVRAVNEHRHSDPIPETHLAANYKWLMTDCRHDEPRLDRAPNRPTLAMSDIDSEEFSENMLDWAKDHPTYSWWNTTLEEMLRFTGKRLSQSSGRLFRMTRGSGEETIETTDFPRPVNALLNGPMGEPDLFILTGTQRSSLEMAIRGLEVGPDEAPRWAESLERAAKDEGYGRIADREFFPFGNKTPGSWGLATRFVALHREECDSWLQGYENFVIKAFEECHGGKAVGGTVAGDLQVLCYTQGKAELVVHLESHDASELRSWTIRPNPEDEFTRSAPTPTTPTPGPGLPGRGRGA